MKYPHAYCDKDFDHIPQTWYNPSEMLYKTKIKSVLYNRVFYKFKTQSWHYNLLSMKLFTCGISNFPSLSQIVWNVLLALKHIYASDGKTKYIS